MPPKLNYPLSITGLSSRVNDVVTITNRNTGETLRNIKHKIIKLNSKQLALVDLANLTNGWSIGDVIEIRVTGTLRSGSATHTTSRGTSVRDIKVTTAANPSWRVTIR